MSGCVFVCVSLYLRVCLRSYLKVCVPSLLSLSSICVYECHVTAGSSDCGPYCQVATTGGQESVVSLLTVARILLPKSTL